VQLLLENSSPTFFTFSNDTNLVLVAGSRTKVHQNRKILPNPALFFSILSSD
jgi:hypothetical protein